MVLHVLLDKTMFSYKDGNIASIDTETTALMIHVCLEIMPMK